MLAPAPAASAWHRAVQQADKFGSLLMERIEGLPQQRARLMRGWGAEGGTGPGEEVSDPGEARGPCSDRKGGGALAPMIG